MTQFFNLIFSLIIGLIFATMGLGFIFMCFLYGYAFYYALFSFLSNMLMRLLGG